jgi:hypothetical protein
MARPDEHLDHVLFKYIDIHYRTPQEVKALASRLDPNLKMLSRTEGELESWCTTDLVSACRDKGILDQLKDLVIREQLNMSDKDLAELYSVNVRRRSAVISVAPDKQDLMKKISIRGLRVAEGECTSSGMKVYLDVARLMGECSVCGIVLGQKHHPTIRGTGKTICELVFDCAFFWRLPVRLYYSSSSPDVSFVRRARPLIEARKALISEVFYEDDVGLMALMQDIAGRPAEDPLVERVKEEISIPRALKAEDRLRLKKIISKVDELADKKGQKALIYDAGLEGMEGELVFDGNPGVIASNWIKWLWNKGELPHKKGVYALGALLQVIIEKPTVPDADIEFLKGLIREYQLVRD